MLNSQMHLCFHSWTVTDVTQRWDNKDKITPLSLHWASWFHWSPSVEKLLQCSFMTLWPLPMSPFLVPWDFKTKQWPWFWVAGNIPSNTKMTLESIWSELQTPKNPWGWGHTLRPSILKSACKLVYFISTSFTKEMKLKKRSNQITRT